jgi:hypothetical protein
MELTDFPGSTAMSHAKASGYHAEWHDKKREFVLFRVEEVLEHKRLSMY